MPELFERNKLFYLISEGRVKHNSNIKMLQKFQLG